MMKSAGKRLITGLLILLQLQLLPAQERDFTRPQLIPKPEKEMYTGGYLPLPSLMTLSKDFDPDAGELLKSMLSDLLHIDVCMEANEKSFIRFYKEETLESEAYRIITDSTGIGIYASGEEGTRWAAQTLHQLFMQTYSHSPGEMMSVPLMMLEDAPRYPWRGFHLDVARHLFTKEYLKKTIERLSFYKINKLHLHLTDDQGWRIEIDKYPLLTEVGAWRRFDKYDSICIRKSACDPDMALDKRFIREDSLYGGFYTKADMREIIAHARHYGIEIIPEIDMPGHMSAAIRAYPWLSCSGATGWGEEFSHPVCTCNPKVVQFAKDVYSEIADLFPSEYLHIGADEVDRTTWEQCTECRKRMNEEGLTSSEGLQTLFVEEMRSFLRTKGKKTLVWDDAAEDRISSDIVVTFWRDWKNENANRIVQKGHPMIFMTWSHFYLSARPSYKRWEELYHFDISKDYPGMTDEKVMGYQACVWTEEIPTEAKLEEHIFPSLQAYSELIWSRERNWKDFLSRMPLHQTGLTHWSQTKWNNSTNLQ